MKKILTVMICFLVSLSLVGCSSILELINLENGNDNTEENDGNTDNSVTEDNNNESNEEDEKLLQTDEYQEKIIDSIYKGIVNFLQIK